MVLRKSTTNRRFLPAVGRVLALLTGAAALAGAPAGCGGGDNDKAAVTTSPTRLVNALTTAAGPLVADVEQPPALQARRLATGAALSYREVPVGTVALKLTDTSGATMEASFTLADRDDYRTIRTRTLIAYGVLGATEETRKPAVLLLDDPKKPEGLGDKFAAVRVAHVAPGIGPVDLYVGDKPVLGATRITFGNATPYRPLPVEGASLSLYEAAGKLTLPTLTRGTDLLPGKAYTVLLFGERGKTLDAVVVPDE